MNAAIRRRLVSLRNQFQHHGVEVSSGSSLNPQAQIERGVRFGRDCTVLKASLRGPCLVDDRVLICDNVTINASKLGSDCRIETNASVSGSLLESNVAVHQNAELCGVNVGRFSYIARETILNEVDVGRFCSIGPRCLIGSGEHPVDWISTSPVFYSAIKQTGRSFAESLPKNASFTERRQIAIGNDVWIGAHVFVRDGVNIGNGAIVAAGAVVIRDVPAFAVVGGVPARNIRFRFQPEHIEEMQSIAWWNWSEELLRKAQPLISSANIEPFLAFAREHNSRL